MPFNTRNPIPSGDLRDLDDNARNIDTWANDKTKFSHPDRFGVERRTWHGIEQEAKLNIQQAIDAKNAAQEAAMMSGFSKYADTLAQLEAGIGTDYIEGDVVLVFEDESRGDTSSIFKIESGAAEFKQTFDKTRQDLLSFTGNLSTDAQWTDVPAHSDPAFDVQAQALANRTVLLRENQNRTPMEYATLAEAEAAAATLPDGQVVDVEGNNTRYDVASGELTGARPITALSVAAGIVRSVQGKLGKELLSVLDFGAIGDGLVHPLSERFSTLAMAQVAYPHATSLSQSTDWAATQAALNYGKATGYSIHQPAGVYTYTDGLIYDGSFVWSGDGFFADVNQSVPQWNTLAGTVLLACGTGPKNRFAYGVTDERTSGGVVLNPDADFGATDATFSLASYYNEDANTATGAAATPKAFSALVWMPRGTTGARMRDMRMVLNFNGIDGYKNKVLSLADNWDVGLYVDNARYNEFRNIQIYGYWRLNGLLIRSGALAWEVADGLYAGAEENKFYDCVFQGWKSVGMRSIGMWRCMAVTSTYIEVPWANNHPFDMTKDARITRGEFSQRNMGVSSIEKVGDRLRFYTTADQTAFVSVGQEILPAYVGNGVAGTVMEHCRLHGMWHTSDRRISDPAITGAMPPSACLEISGSRIRGPRFEGCKLQTVDDIGPHLHQCIDVILGPNARFEGSTPSANGGAGIRAISTPAAGDANYPGRVRETYRVQLHMEQPACDFTPAFGSVAAKFSTPGFWFPNMGSEVFHAGLIVGGDPTGANFMREYLQSGFTPVFTFATQGDLAVSSQTRSGSVEIVGDWVRFNLYHSARLTFTTASGNLQIKLPYAMINQANLKAVLQCSYEGITLPAGRTQLHAEASAGSDQAVLVASGSGVARQNITAANLASGAFVTLTISGTYKINR